MASIINRNGKFHVVFSYTNEDGQKKQKWVSCKTEAEAKRKKKEFEYKNEMNKMIMPRCGTVNELMEEYVSLYGKNKWSLSVYTSNKALIKNYITPYIGKMKLQEVSPRVLERYYQKLLQTNAVSRMTDSKFKKEKRLVGTSTIRDVHKLIKSAFMQAMKWDLVDKNPAVLAEVPKHEGKKRDIWDMETLAHANEICPDQRLKLCINLAFACSLRVGELLGLTWNCVNIDEDSMKEDRAYIFVNKELQRVTKDSLEELENKGVLSLFPEIVESSKTRLVLKEPKTPTSVRKVYLPKSVAEMLNEWKKHQDSLKAALGDEYRDYDLVITTETGTPVEQRRIEKSFKDFIRHYGLPDVVFHSLRHSSITYKLRLTGGDIKAVQGDSGHAQAKMVTDQYSHILDESRKENAHLLENAFYSRNNPAKETEEEKPDQNAESETSSIDMATVNQILQNPEMLKLLVKLSKAVGQ